MRTRRNRQDEVRDRLAGLRLSLEIAVKRQRCSERRKKKADAAVAKLQRQIEIATIGLAALRRARSITTTEGDRA